MARFLTTYYIGHMPSDPDSIADARRAFMQWAEQAGPALAEVGAPVRSATTIDADGARDAVAGQPLMGWSVIEAADSDAAVRLVRDHPFISSRSERQASWAQRAAWPAVTSFRFNTYRGTSAQARVMRLPGLSGMISAASASHGPDEDDGNPMSMTWAWERPWMLA